jgi:site-specific DNA-methyltransferase (adenine-specific)
MPLQRHEDVLVFGRGRLIYNPQMRTGLFRVKGFTTPGKTSDCYGGHQRVSSRNDQYYPTSVIEIGNTNRAEKQHPTQKPVALGEYLIRTYSNEGDLVLDNTMGVASFGVAALNTGRRFIGIERDEGYFAIAERRLHDAATAARQERLEIA